MLKEEEVKRMLRIVREKADLNADYAALAVTIALKQVLEMDVTTDLKVLEAIQEGLEVTR